MVEIPKKSRVALLVEYGKPLEMGERPIPEVEPNAILVKNELAGVCGTDVHQWRGKMGIKAPLPNIMGHETVGRIVKLGEGRTHDSAGIPLKVGDRILWAHVECGECYYCKILREPCCCTNKIWYAYHCADEYPYLWGGYADYSYIIPKTDVVKVPDELSNEEVVGIACAFRTSMAAYERMGGYIPGESVVIQGSGPIGLYALALAVAGGAGRIIVIGGPSERLAMARKWGAEYVVDIDEIVDPAARLAKIMELTDGRGADVVVEGSGGKTAFQEALDMVRPAGRISVIGQTSLEHTNTIQPGKLLFKHVKIFGQKGANIQHYYFALRFILKQRRRFSFADIVTNTYSLEQANEALAAMASFKEMKAGIEP